ncbi:MAG: hypothetical protein FVQ83_02610 [Chloroflexi bacterium]|nr:hypothetical protein [Chloroflexota bacterium]
MQKEIVDFPEKLWFTFPEENSPFVTDRADGFLTSLIFPAMYLGVPIEVRGVVSPKLAYNIETFQKIHHLMLPNIFQPMEVKYNTLSELPTKEVLGGVGTSFSGGIDSSYVIWNHLTKPKSNPLEQLSHGLFIHGFDISLNDSEIYQSLYRKYLQFFERWGLTLIQARSNYIEFTKFRINWLFAHNGLQIGCAQVLGKLFNRFIKPGGDEMSEGHVEEPGYHIHLLSTGSMDVSLHSPYILRLDKLSRMAEWEDIREYLWVCSNLEKQEDGNACNDCAKCLNTLVYLDLLKLQPEFVNFPNPLSIKLFLKFLVRNLYLSVGMGYYKEHLTRFAKLAGRYDILIAFWLFYIPSEIMIMLKLKFLGLIPRDLKYKIKQRVYR